MASTSVLARGNEPHSAVSNSGLASVIARKFERELERMVAELGREDLTPTRLRSFVGGLKSLLAVIGRDALVGALESADAPSPTAERDGQRLRYRGLADCEWLTAFGRITVRRRVYRGAGRGAASAVPLDEACGMQGRFMTADLEELAALGMAMLTAREVEQLLGRTLPEGPSATAIQNVVRRVGDELGTQRAAIEAAIEEQAPLTPDGDVLAVSWDGVMTPMREPNKVAWREAGVAVVSVYGPSAEGPAKLDSRLFARMPESGMKSLLDDVVEQVSRARRARDFRQVVVLCDGKETIWDRSRSSNRVGRRDLDPRLLPCCGEPDEGGHRDLSATRPRRDAGMRSSARSSSSTSTVSSTSSGRCARYRRLLPGDCKERKVVRQRHQYFRDNRARMQYAQFIALGLPIGSGPVESAAKNLVQARLKRSGMRWSHQGGQHVLDLRAYLKSDRWEPMWSSLTSVA
jgi:hypothetical protein